VRRRAKDIDLPRTGSLQFSRDSLQQVCHLEIHNNLLKLGFFSVIGKTAGRPAAPR
jgi:hypothetical protein